MDVCTCMLDVLQFAMEFEADASFRSCGGEVFSTEWTDLTKQMVAVQFDRATMGNSLNYAVCQVIFRYNPARVQVKQW